LRRPSGLPEEAAPEEVDQVRRRRRQRVVNRRWHGLGTGLAAERVEREVAQGRPARGGGAGAGGGARIGRWRGRSKAERTRWPGGRSEEEAAGRQAAVLCPAEESRRRRKRIQLEVELHTLEKET